MPKVIASLNDSSPGSVETECKQGSQLAKTQLQNVVNAVKTTVWRIIREWERERLRERQCVCVLVCVDGVG